MNGLQISLPFRRRSTESRPNSNYDLIGRSYQQDKYATVTVTGICAEDAARVIVERDTDEKRWTMPGWLIRLIFLEDRKRAA